MASTASVPVRRATPHLLILLTQYVTPLRGAPFYEVTAAFDAQRSASRLVFVTRDEDAYQLALDAEGEPQRFTATWHPGRRSTGHAAQILDRLDREL